jgi:hypothetical protein
VIESVTASDQRELDNVDAWQIRQRGVNEMRFSFGNKIKNVHTTRNVDGLDLASGSLVNFSIGGDLIHSSLNVAGTITSASIGGTLKGSSTVNARGPEGRILSLTTKKALFGEVFGEVAIGTIKVGTDLGSSTVRASANLSTLDVGGSLLDGAFVKVDKKLSELIVGGTIEDGAVVQAGSIGSQNVGGGVNGDIRIG